LTKQLASYVLVALLLTTNGIISMDILQRFNSFMSSRQPAQQEQRGGAVVTGTVQDAPKPAAKPVDYTDTVWFIESSRGKKMDAPTSSAKGHFQFIDSTWKGFVDKYKLGYKPEDRYDFDKAKKVFDLYTEENKKLLIRDLGREPTYTEKYLAFKLDGKNAVKLLKSPPNTTVDKVVSKAAINANKSVFMNKDGSYKKVIEVYKYFDNFFQQKQ
jgi:hypothetical protein